MKSWNLMESAPQRQRLRRARIYCKFVAATLPPKNSHPTTK